MMSSHAGEPLSIADVWANSQGPRGSDGHRQRKGCQVQRRHHGPELDAHSGRHGDAADKTNDLTVTTDDEAGVGDTVTATGIVGIDKDFTAGYVYPVIVENARVVKR